MENKQQLDLNTLLKWGIEHSTANEDPTIDRSAQLEKIDPKWIDLILGKPDAVRMRDAMDAILNADQSRDLSERLAYFDELELLVESIDNANDLKPCKLWAPLLDLMTAQKEPEDIRKFAAWVVATALQNNPKAIKDWAEAGGLAVLTRAVKQESSASVVAKLVAIASALVNDSPTHWIPLLHADGTLQSLAMALHARPRHPSAKRLLHMLANVMDAVPSVAQMFSGKGWMEQMVDVHVRCTNEGPDYLEKALQFVVLVSKHVGQDVLAAKVWVELREVVDESEGADPGAVDEEVVKQIRETAGKAVEEMKKSSQP
ncbi:nucleotide exchange factor Fes1-domain-containing protein [Catenaria anguillulae PL171]|uniref:Nucleotide exchange factor Fes1-domain-containing protein n=1 Tax=Catenaria anguillulae PL171 TaxID=765915 RepID=A0A1Y2HXG6_9FUNG|nr:nucleotide exchange factor Fes1-domain-containing protein [Catenaria anguillulae PL171]